MDASRRRWQRLADSSQQHQQRQLDAVLDVTMLTGWKAVSEALRASSPRETLAGLIQHFIITE